MTLYELSQEIAKLEKEKKYKDALSYFKANKNQFKEDISKNEYIISNIVSCLRKSNQIDAGFKFLELYNIEINSEQKERILTSYGWLLWSKYKLDNKVGDDIDDSFDDDEDDVVQHFHMEKSEVLHRIEHFLPIISTIKNEFAATLRSNLFNIVLKSEKKKPSPNWKLIVDFCNQIDRNSLSKECSTISIVKKGKPTDTELASDYENWYAYITKALAKLGRWQECTDYSREALDNIEKFHYSNDVWFLRRIALAKKNTGNINDAINELERILKKKREWFIQKELAELYFEQANIEKAFKYALDSINNSGPIEFKIDLLFLLGKILKQKGELELSFKHISLSKQIRQTEEWKNPMKLQEEINSYNRPELPIADLNKLKVELQKYWGSFTKMTGKVNKILHNDDKGLAGFIKFKDKKLYFKIHADNKLKDRLKVGSEVSFEIVPKKDKQKNDSATKIILIK